MSKYVVGSLFLIAALAFAAHHVAQRYGYAGWNFWVAFVSLVLLLIPFFAVGSSRVVVKLKAKVASKRSYGVALITGLLVPYLIYALGIGVFNWPAFGKLVAYMMLPSLLIWSIRSPAQKLYWQDIAAILALILPFELSWLSGIWPWPRQPVGYFFHKLLGVDLAIFLFLVIRRLPSLGYTFRIEKADLLIALRNYMLFLPIGIALGLATRFVHLSMDPIRYGQALVTGVGMFFFTAFPEEFIFRGVIQNLLCTHRDKYTALVMASLSFGLAHAFSGDWRYVLLSSIAGIFYGHAYLKTKRLSTSALVHTLVNLTWKLFFRR